MALISAYCLLVLHIPHSNGTLHLALLRLAETDRSRLLDLYETLPIRADGDLGSDIIRRLHGLAEEYALSAYGAAYLELAQRKDLGLATLDQPLIKAARRAGVNVVRL